MNGGTRGLDRVAANERRFLSLARAGGAAAAIDLACECTSGSCHERITMERARYQPVRASAARYVVCPTEHHVDPSMDRVVESGSQYWVVERDPDVEMLTFYSSRASTVTAELAALARDTRLAGAAAAPGGLSLVRGSTPDKDAPR